MEIVTWVRVTIEAHENGKRDETRVALWSFDMPRDMYLQPLTKRRIGWIGARFQYFNPKLIFSHCLSFYDKKTGLDLNYKSAMSRLISAKGQVTKVTNAIEAAKAQFTPTLFLRTFEDTDTYKNAQKKLDRLKAELNQRQLDVDTELQKMQESQTIDSHDHQSAD